MSVSRVSYTGRWLQRIPPVSTRELIPPASLIHFSTSLTNLRLLWASSPSFTKVCVSACEDWKTEMWTPALMALGGRAGGEWGPGPCKQEGSLCVPLRPWETCPLEPVSALASSPSLLAQTCPQEASFTRCSDSPTLRGHWL